MLNLSDPCEEQPKIQGRDRYQRQYCYQHALLSCNSQWCDKSLDIHKHRAYTKRYGKLCLSAIHAEAHVTYVPGM
jgi:hypothetical protein